ncbi:serine/threonine-protein kinase [Rhodopirellula sallentina]|uniref:Serine/threonine protein kinase n=1 Tax=Rhodopirellula sallentina SM41 TaxID=1263870 RepID=M5TVM5_9BACT|nr:serine/threonine-protein kinase [Rhodopirellula sallentina]EMI53210.1 serine/threonine protein kinase [Rhodopirellula sallentina SM41]
MHDPETSDDDLAAVDTLASDFLARYRDGERPSVEEYARRHPQHSDTIREMFPLVASVERIKIIEQVAEDGSATLAGRELSQLGDFRIVREIGRGGMGIVFEAHQESLDRVVAIKVLPKRSLLDDEALTRFRTEATTAASMHHANIVPIYGSGESEGAHFLVMQLVRGDSLDKMLSAGTEFSFHRVATIGAQVSDAIAYAHAAGVLHRDIKPANILIEEQGTAQVTDFGLARNLDNEATKTHAVSGSLRYMAPERFTGVSEETGDVYGIGITLHELLVGQPAFQANDAEHLMGLIAQGRIKPVNTLRPDVPIDLATIVSKAIHVDPSLRYPSAAELGDDLKRFLADEPIHARRTSICGRLFRWIRRNPKLAGAVGIAAFALTAATVISTIALFVTAAANQRSEEALRSSEETVDLALQSLDGVVDIVSQSPTSASLPFDDAFDDDLLPKVDLEISPSTAQVLERLQPIYERLSQQSPTRSDIVLRRVDSSIQLARIQHSLGRTADSIETLRSSLTLLSERDTSNSTLESDLQLRIARLNNELGTMYAAEYQRDGSVSCYLAAIDAASELGTTNVAGQTELARAHLYLGDRPPQLRHDETFTRERRSDALSHIDQAILILEELRESSTPTKTINILYASSLSARSQLMQGPKLNHIDFDAAISVLRQQLESTPQDATVRFELVKTLAEINLRGPRSPRQLGEARKRLSEALREIETLLASHPANTVYLTTEVHLRHKLSAIARTQARYDHAADLLSEAIQIQTRLLQAQPDSVAQRCWRAMLYRSQATLYHQWDKPDAAETAFANAKADVLAIDPEWKDHPFVVRTSDTVRKLDETLTRPTR